MLGKEPGLDNFIPVGDSKKNLTSTELAQTYKKTEEALRSKMKDLIDQGVDSSKVERDLNTFYKSISQKYNLPINSREDFIKIMDNLDQYDDVMEQAKNTVRETSVITDKDLSNLSERSASIWKKDHEWRDKSKDVYQKPKSQSDSKSNDDQITKKLRKDEKTEKEEKDDFTTDVERELDES